MAFSKLSYDISSGELITLSKSTHEQPLCSGSQKPDPLQFSSRK